jgi:hypothetical protein
MAMTDKLEVGEAAARAPRLEPGDFRTVVAVFRRYAADVRRQGEGDPACDREAEAWQRAAEILEHEQAARAPREPLEPPFWLEALMAARNVLAAFAKDAGWLPEQRAYSTTMTEGERKLAQAVADLDRIIDGEAAARSALPPLENQGVDPMPVLTFADYWRCRRCQTVTHSPTTGRPPGQCAGKALGSTSYGTCTNPMDSDDWDAITNEAVLPRVPEPDLIVAAYEKAVDEWSAQCFCFTSAPEALRRNAHEAAREGFAAIRDILGPLARPILDAEYKAAEQQAKADVVRAARAGAEAPPPEEP